VPSYLSYNPDRRAAWVEHDNFPKGAVKYRGKLREKFIEWGQPNRQVTLRIYQIHPGRDTITEIPESEWDDHQA
jgi:hypothetical protein